MTFIDAVAVLAKQWEKLPGMLNGSARQRFEALAAEARRAVSDRDHARIWHDVVDLMQRELPPAGGLHRELLAALDVPRFRTNRDENALPRLPWLTRHKPEIVDWILAARSISPDTVLRRGNDPQQPGLIRLRRPGGQWSLPGFQFTRKGDPKPLVLRINQLLGADADPWGVADWWLCPNVWLSGTPAELLDRVDDDLLVAAAVAAVEG